jgi:hypothetical protein
MNETAKVHAPKTRSIPSDRVLANACRMARMRIWHFRKRVGKKKDIPLAANRAIRGFPLIPLTKTLPAAIMKILLIERMEENHGGRNDG